MFDVNLTKSAIAQVEEAQELNRQLSHLMTDIADGRGYMIMQGATTVSVVSRMQGERKVVKVYPSRLLQAKRYTKDDATRRLSALDPKVYRVVRIREAIKAQGDAMAAYSGELLGFLRQTCTETGMELTA
ncbi:hypothetical protein AhyVDH1_054 [Aeromonas phage AhyVDH1]|nr:hypothetical protein AhyVDH1_054 [Aeromonas phage AhyVDH1]